MTPTAGVLPGTDAWERAMGLCVGAYVDEPFVIELFGDDPSARARGLERMFLGREPWPGAQVIGVERDGVLVGSVVVCQPGACHACARDGDTPPAQDSPEHSEWQFEQNLVGAHRGLGRHGWMSKVAVDPTARGMGLGRHLVERARAVCDGPLVLECQPHRGDFYRACGFSVVGTVADPAGPDALVMRAEP